MWRPHALYVATPWWYPCSYFYVRHAVTFIKVFLYCSLIVVPFDTRLLTLMKTLISKSKYPYKDNGVFLSQSVPGDENTFWHPSKPSHENKPSPQTSLFAFVRGKRRRRRRTAQGTLWTVTWCFSDRASWIDYTLITNLMNWLLFIHKILFSSTCFEPEVLIFRRI